MSTRLTHSQISLPADDEDVMAWSAARDALRKWEGIADSTANARTAAWARRNAAAARTRLSIQASRIRKRQQDARRAPLASAGMTLSDLLIYKARRKHGEVWLVKIFQRSAAEFPLRDQAQTFADFAPLLIAQGTCPACLEKHADLRQHIGTAACNPKKGAQA